MADTLPWSIFISYRREDAAPYARMLQMEMEKRFPDRRLFMDMDSIEPGMDFTEAIRNALATSAVLLALIGPQWATLAGTRRRRRLDDPDDFVRFEVRTALERGMRVIPVLVNGARALGPQDLPADLQQFARLQAFEWSDTRYRQDAAQLLDLVQRAFDAVEAKAEVPSLDLRARSAEQIGDAATARDLYAELADERERALGPEHPDTLAARSNLARLTGKAGNAAGAREQFNALLPVYTRVLGPGHPDTLAAHRGKAYWTNKAGNLYGALQVYLELQSAAKNALGDDHPLVIEIQQERNYLDEMARDQRKHPEIYSPKEWERWQREQREGR